MGEALISTLRNKGEPSMVQRALIRPPMGRVGPLKQDERKVLLDADTEMAGKYRDEVVTEGAYERVQAMNTMMGNVNEKLDEAKEKLGGWFGIGRKDG